MSFIQEFDGRAMHTHKANAFAEAQSLSDANGCPCMVWARDGWYLACEIPPELFEVEPESLGWVSWALVDPRSAWHAPTVTELSEARS